MRATPSYAQDEDEHLILHGYFTQAFAKTTALPLLGIPRQGTWNYRVLALQARYLLDEKSELVVQGLYRQSGISPLNDQSPNINFAYYQHKFDLFTVAVGKLPFPQGLYNSIREVGTILPFYRAPANYYYLTAFEVMEGISVTNTTVFGPWSLESTAYAGALDNPYVVPTPTGLVAGDFRAERNYGGQIWLETPVRGLRLGINGVSYQIPTATDTVRRTLLGASVDGTFNHFFTRAEFIRFALPEFGPNGTDEIEVDSYAEAGVKLLKEVSLNTQLARSTIHYPGRTYASTYDRVAGLSYAPSSNLVMKLEGHHTTGYSFDVPQAITQPPGKTNYWIASVSTSF